MKEMTLSARKKKVLLVDPDPTVRKMLTNFLGKGQLLVAKDFIQGWKMLDESRHDLALVVARATIRHSRLKKNVSAHTFVSLARQIGEGFEPILVNGGDPDANLALVGPGMATHATNGTDLMLMVDRILGL